VLKNAKTDEDISKCFDVMVELRPHLTSDTFVPTVRAMETEGYQLAFMEDNGRVVAATGYRICTNLFMGKHLYVDDLVTLSEARSRGHGESVIRWLRKKAVEADCNYFHLDSGTHRGQAHKFYFKQGFTIASYHFSEQLNVS